MRRAASGPPAVVLGDIDLVRPLAREGIRCAVFAARYDPVHLSRQVFKRLEFNDPWARPEAVVQTILRFAGEEEAQPVLMPQGDGELLVVSRHRERFAERCSFVLADANLIEDLVDKARFLDLARRLELPVPAAERVHPARMDVGEIGLRYPLIVKPLLRNPELWRPVAGCAKAVDVPNKAALTRLWARMSEVEGLEVLVQEQSRAPRPGLRATTPTSTPRDESPRSSPAARSGRCRRNTGRARRCKSPSRRTWPPSGARLSSASS